MTKKQQKNLGWIAATISIVAVLLLTACVLWLCFGSGEGPVAQTIDLVVEWIMCGFLAILIGAVLALLVHEMFLRTSTDKDYDGTTVEQFLEKYKNKLLLILTLLSMMVIWEVPEAQWLKDLWSLVARDMPFVLPPTEDLFGYYAAQLSLTFITISVMGVLSDGSVLIYWVNAAEERLIKPTFSSFAAYTYYSVGATIGAGVAVFTGNGPAFFTYFAVNVLILVLLTMSMIDVYFAKDRTKNNLRQQLIRDERHYRKKKADKPLTIYERSCANRYEEAIRGLRQNIYHARSAADLELLADIYRLYFSTAHTFSEKPGSQIPQVMVDTLEEPNFSGFCGELDRFVREMPRQKANRVSAYQADDYFYDYRWDMDKPLWGALSKSEYLLHWVESLEMRNEIPWELTDLILVVKRRLMQLHNDMVTRYAEEKDWDTDLYLLTMGDNGAVTLEADGKPISREASEQVFEAAAEELVGKGTLGAYLMQTMLILWHQDEEINSLIAPFRDLPIAKLLAENCATMGFSRVDTVLLITYFKKI